MTRSIIWKLKTVHLANGRLKIHSNLAKIVKDLLFFFIMSTTGVPNKKSIKVLLKQES